MTKLLLDTNIAVLFVVGITNINYIGKHKRLQKYDVKDYENVCEFIAISDGLVFSPNVLSESSNMLRYIDGVIAREVSITLQEIMKKVEEECIPSHQAALRAEYIRLGLTDAVLLEQAVTGATLLTDDHDLYRAALAAELKAINYAHVQDERPDFR